ncbi:MULTISPECIES: DUF397 domain-containing protein [unclassified Streptomyces]|uniref:DUF397 domain-containing protein n=1 Tax=unclassified Streptomyces TaxID=2593676 RepID=UPI00168AC4DF|nr:MULTISPECIES: DUF397 domain-containing protein [unclassified Streptomyces]MBD3008134.1 DUF397 domain-containing protein [Streptomyces sp. 5-10]
MNVLKEATWFKSSYSTQEAGACVEVANLTWSKSSYSGQDPSACVEIANLTTAVGVRDSKDKTGPALLIPPAAWAAFVSGVRTGRLGRPIE